MRVSRSRQDVNCTGTALAGAYMCQTSAHPQIQFLCQPEPSVGRVFLRRPQHPTTKPRALLHVVQPSCALSPFVPTGSGCKPPCARAPSLSTIHTLGPYICIYISLSLSLSLHFYLFVLHSCVCVTPKYPHIHTYMYISIHV